MLVLLLIFRSTVLLRLILLTLAYSKVDCRLMTQNIIMLLVMLRTLRALCQIGCIVSPFVAFQYYAFIRYCYEPEICEKSEANDCRIDHVWCEDTIPSIYNHIQGTFESYSKIPLRVES